MNSAYEIHRQRAVQMNELAGKVQSPSDSRRLVDMIAEMFADELPPELATRTIRDRVAHAEYESATDPARLVPEQRIVDAWNKYVEEIGAPPETRVNVAEIHNLHDGHYCHRTAPHEPRISQRSGPCQTSTRWGQMKRWPKVAAQWRPSGSCGIWQTFSIISGAPASAYGKGSRFQISSSNSWKRLLQDRPRS